MPLAKLFSSDFVDITFLSATKQLHANWKGYQTDASIHEGSERMLDLMRTYSAYDVLNDNTNVVGIWINAAEWLALDWFPRMKAAGMQRFAWVYSPYRFSQVSTDSTISMLDPLALGIKVFATKPDALHWLDRPDSSANAAPHLPARVLVIEDNKDIAQILRDMLQIMGREPHVAGNARTGLEVARAIVPELIFCDIGLPGEMNGFDFARAARGDQNLKHIPLIAVSGYTSEDTRKEAVDAGFDRLFSKPIRFADINDAVSSFVRSADQAKA